MRLKILCSQERAGSTPALGTKSANKPQLVDISMDINEFFFIFQNQNNANIEIFSPVASGIM